MKKLLILLTGLVAISFHSTAAENGAPASAEWTPLLDANLTQFEKYIGVPDVSVTPPGYTHAADPKQDKPLGLNNDPLNIFTVQLTNGEPVLHITGEIFGELITKKTYDDFHLRVQFRWGTTKHAPRLDKPRDNGILYHCFGEPKLWWQSIECQVQEKDIGDFYSLGGKANVASVTNQMPKGVIGIYTPGAPLRQYVGHCSHGADYHELPNGEWNTIEVMAVGDRSLHILNGHIVNVLQDAVHTVDGKTSPLVTGRLLFQSEGAECEYRKIEICPLASFPAKYQKLFHETNAPVRQP